MKQLFKRLVNRETILYLVFGVLTTVVNYVVFAILIHIFGDEAALIVNVAAFVAAVIFAFITNKLFVFESKSWAGSVLKKEIPSFITARLFAFAIEELGLMFSMNVLHVEKYQLFGIGGVLIAKIILSVVVVIVNYVFSKFFIFKKPEENR